MLIYLNYSEKIVSGKYFAKSRILPGDPDKCTKQLSLKPFLIPIHIC